MAVDLVFLEKIVLAVLVGALLGFEREYSHRYAMAGLRTFSLISLLGAVSTLLSQQLQFGFALTVVAFAAVCVFSLLMYVNGQKRKRFGFTTNISLIIAFVLGVMIALSLFFEAVFLAVLVAVILFSRERLHAWIGGLTKREVADLLEFLVVLGIVFPLLPESIRVGSVEVPILTIWMLIVMISVMNFVAFIAAHHLRIRHKMEVVSFLGGFIDSTATTSALSEMYSKGKEKQLSAAFLVASAGPFIRNLLIVAFIMPSIAGVLVLPVAVGAAVLLLSSYLISRKSKPLKLHVHNPFGVTRAVKMALVILVLFVLLDFLKAYSQNFFLAASFLGGMASSGGTIISITGLASQSAIASNSAMFGFLFAIAGGLLSNVFFMVLWGARRVSGGVLVPSLVAIVTSLALLLIISASY
ncbi:MgtC/SapB family protein [Candidatus Micrarchaeota archaeon]|nr:MgtC/SapB family protein [Candidatus Micrarchaeota archaeon]